jgi:hypothetical protein
MLCITASFIKDYHHHELRVTRLVPDTIPSPLTRYAPLTIFPGSSLQEFRFDDNNILHSYLEEKLLSGEPFISARGWQGQFRPNECGRAVDSPGAIAQQPQEQDTYHEERGRPIKLRRAVLSA